MLIFSQAWGIIQTMSRPLAPGQHRISIEDPVADDPYYETIWTDYVRYRAELRGYELAHIERILRYSAERYMDTLTERLIAVGHIEDVLVMIPYEVASKRMTPVTVHATTRRQINLRLKTGRFANE